MASDLDNSSVSKRISELYLIGEFADINFEFNSDSSGTEYVPAHKSILAIASPVFRAWFFGAGEENNLITKVGKSVKIVDASAGAFKAFLQFFYLQKVTLTMDYIKEVALLADKYEMLDSVNTCVTFLIDQLKTDNVVWIYHLAITLRIDKLKESCKKFVKIFTYEFFKSNAFLHCDQQFLENLLRMDQLQCKETDVIDACVAWAKFNCKEKGMDEMENLRAQLGDCFYLIRFYAMDAKLFFTHTKPLKELFTHDELVNIVYAVPDKFNQNPRTKTLFWNDAKILKYSGSAGGGSLILMETSIRFSTNTQLLLGGFCVCQFKKFDNCSSIVTPKTSIFGSSASNVFECPLTCMIKIFATDNQLDGCIATNIHEESSFKLTNNTDVKMLSSIIPISPHKIYEIRLKFESYLNIVAAPVWEPECQLNDSIIVKFHSNNSSNCPSMFSCLLFNII